MVQIELQNVTPDFIEKEKREVSEVWEKNISIKKGEHLHIVAPSGSGKTSLIQFIYGLRKDYSGNILCDGKNIKTLSAETFSSIRQHQMSIIFQDLKLFENLTARQNIEIKRGLNPFYPESEINVMAKRLNIELKTDQTVKTCSAGEQQRIAIIRALMQPFDFLLLDEPYSHLDEKNRMLAMELIYEECSKRNAAMIFADLKPLDLLKNEKVIML